MNIQSVVLKTISQNTSEAGKVYGMWIMQYHDGQKSISVKLVCGEKKTKDDGSIWYVAKGMGVRDFETLRPHYAEFAALAKNPPAIKAPEAPQENTEEVPF
mgnify:FL=1